MPDNPEKFDPYREALVVETNTIWPPECDNLNPEEKTRIEKALHADPEKAAQMLYVRLHTGFCRQITVTPEDVDRAKSG